MIHFRLINAFFFFAFRLHVNLFYFIQLRHKLRSIMDRSANLISLENRHSCKRKKKTSMSDIREIYNDETRQRGNKEKEEKQKHINFIQSICNHGQSLIQWHRATHSKRLKLGRS